MEIGISTELIEKKYFNFLAKHKTIDIIARNDFKFKVYLNKLIQSKIRKSH